MRSQRESSQLLFSLSFSNVVLITVENGGHTWPGAIPYPSSGNTCQDFNASSTIWNFFNKYQVENPTMPEPEPIVDTTTSINEFYTDFEIYPNPFNNELMVKFNNNKTKDHSFHSWCNKK